MAFTEKELLAFRVLLKEEFELQITPFRKEINQRLDELVGQIDGLYPRDEVWAQEYIFMRGQLERLENAQ